MKNKIIGVTPLICVVTYLLIGFTADIWHPTWCIFFLIPIVPAFFSKKGLFGLFPLIIAVTYVVLGVTLEWWIQDG